METLHLSGFIYVLVCDQLNCCKIGWSQTTEGVEQRVTACNTFCPATIRLACTFPGSQDDEKALHGFFKLQHIRREWFVLSDEIKRLIHDAKLEAVGKAPVRQSWNPARWIARGEAQKRAIRKPTACLRKKPDRKKLLMYFRHPITGREVSKMTDESDRTLAMQEAIGWRDEWWEAFCEQIHRSKRTRETVVL